MSELVILFFAFLLEQVQLFSEHVILKRYNKKYLSKKVFDKVEGGNSILGKIFDVAQVTPQAIGKCSLLNSVLC